MFASVQNTLVLKFFIEMLQKSIQINCELLKKIPIENQPNRFTIEEVREREN